MLRKFSPQTYDQHKQTKPLHKKRNDIVKERIEQLATLIVYILSTYSHGLLPAQFHFVSFLFLTMNSKMSIEIT